MFEEREKTMQQMLQSDAINVDDVLARNADTVYRIAYARTHKKQDAEDIFQEVFLRYIRSNPAFETEEHERAWMIHVTLNCIRSYYTTAEQRHAVSVDTFPTQGTDRGSDDDFELLLLSLPEEYRLETHLFYGEQMSIRQIANETGRTENAVRVRLNRARNMLKANLKGDEF